MGSMLLSHLNPGNASKFSISLHGDAVLDGKHTFVMIPEVDNKAIVDNFMQPFSQAGPVEIYPASACETVVERAGC
jgi:hypothetical protein